MRTPTELTELFRDSGRKITPQRQCIFRILQDNHAHPTAEAVYEMARIEMEAISLKTVYQTLNDLADMGEILSLDLGTGSFRFDPNVTSHHHLVCTRCGEIRDLDFELEVPTLPDEVQQDYALDRAEITFRGLCPACRQSQSQVSNLAREGQSYSTIESR
ncbi:MAG TPA: Fur family transcriptional regulator [Acidimicrobiales bacterium]|nr:Fur family transcriptional regulator [Acidimicrobiales bacterium]